MKAKSFHLWVQRSFFGAALLLPRVASAAPEPPGPVARPAAPSPAPAGASPGAPAPAARAPEAAVLPPEPPGPAEPYWHHILAADGLAVAVGLGAFAASSPWRDRADDPPGAPAFVATSAYGLGAVLPPAVHFAHRQTAMGFVSLGMRLTVPPLTGLVGLVGDCTAREGRSPCARDGVIGGMLVGEAIVAAIDAAVLARDRPGARAAPPVNWYGWQTLAVDAGVVGLSAYLVSRPRPPPDEGEERRPRHVLDVGVGWYALSWLGAPVVHFAHGRVGIGFADLGVRLVAPALTVLPGIVGACAGTGGRDGCVDAGARAGLLGGVMLAAAFDAFVLAKEKRPEPDDDASFFWAPVLQPAPGGATAGLVGAF